MPNFPKTKLHKIENILGRRDVCSGRPPFRFATEVHLSGFVIDISSGYYVETPSPPAATISPSSPYVGMHPGILWEMHGILLKSHKIPVKLRGAWPYKVWWGGGGWVGGLLVVFEHFTPARKM